MRRLPASLLALLAFASCETHDKEIKTESETTPASPQQAPAAASKAKSDSLTTFTWQDEMCEHFGAYPAGTYTEKQLRDTYDLVSFPGILTSPTVFNLEQYTDAHFDKAGKDLEAV